MQYLHKVDNSHNYGAPALVEAEAEDGFVWVLARGISCLIEQLLG